VCREIAYHLTRNKQQVAYIALEENVKRSIRGIVGLELNKPIHLPEVFNSIPKEELKTAWENVSTNINFYNHFGSTDSKNLLSKIKYFVSAIGCKWVILDHVNIAVSGIDEGDERRLIDNIMTRLRSLVEELQFGLILVCHLKRPVNSNKGHEEGLNTSMSQLRGSAGIGQLTDICIGCERNQQDNENSNQMTLRILKNRFNGTTGIASYLSYNPETNRLTENNYDFE
jgi:twinkle protein